MSRVWLTVFCVLGGAAPSNAVLVTVARHDLERALALARWPTTDADRARFHKAYTFTIHNTPVEYVVLSSIEVITEFRRVELLAEAHARTNDLWGRGGMQDVEDTIKPWRGRVTIVAHVTFLPTTTFIAGVPPIEVILTGNDLKPVGLARNGVYAHSAGPGAGAALVSEDIEQTLDSQSVGQVARAVRVVWIGRELGRTLIDFGALQ